MKKVLFIILTIVSLIQFIGVTKSYAVVTWDYTVTGGPSLPLDTTGATLITCNTSANCSGDDDGYLIQFPFTFKVYESNYSTSNNFSMNSNGYIRFDASIGAGVNWSSAGIPTNSASFGQFLSYGGTGDGMIVNSLIKKKIFGTAPNRVLSMTFVYYTNIDGGASAYHATVQVNLYETTNVIKVHYYNCGGNTYPGLNIGINEGDGIHGNNLGNFPSQDTCFTFVSGSTLVAPVSITPTVISSSQIDLTWVKNLSGNDVIVAYNTTNNFGNPVDGNPYTQGQTLGGVGTVLYVGALTAKSHTGLNAGTTYYYKAWSKNASNNYSALGVTNAATTNTVGTPSSFNAIPATTTKIDLTWGLNGVGDTVVIFANSSNNFASPVTGSYYGVGQSVVINQGTVIYRGKLAAFSHTGLSVATNYFYKIFSVNSNLNYSTGLTANAITNSVANPQSFTIGTITPSSITLNWQLNASFNNVIVAVNTTNTFATPITGQSYPTGNQIQTNQGTIIYNGSLQTFLHSGLLNNATYYYKIWSYDAIFNYSTGLTASASTNGVSDPVTFDATAVSASQIDLSWTKNATGQNVMIAWNTVNDFASPFNGFPYLVGNEMDVSKGWILYRGGAVTSFSHTGRLPNTWYYYKVWSYDGSNYYSTPGMVDSALTAAPGISTFPYIETFDALSPSYTGNVACNNTYVLSTGWQNVTGDDIDWIPFSGPTYYALTGPSGDHTSGTGKYVYVAGFGTTSCYNKTGYLVSPLLNFQYLTNPKLEFFYHMYGTQMGNLSVQVSTDGGGTWGANLFYINGQQTASKTAAYTKADISLAAYQGMSNIKIRIKAFTGYNYLTDMAVDDIKVYQPQNMTFVSSTTEQTTTPAVLGANEQAVMKIKISTVGTLSPLMLTSLSLNTNGSTNANADITSARLYYTNNSQTFNALQPVGAAWTNFSSPSFTLTTNQALQEGDNYFWIAYNISPSATIGDFVDAELNSFVLSTVTKIPPVKAPVGNNKIVGQFTVGSGTVDNQNGPLYAPFFYGAHEMIYLASEIGTGAKELNKIAFFKASGTNVIDNYNNVTIYLKNTTDAVLGSASVSYVGYTQVYNGVFPNNITTGWLDVAFTSPFLWDGTSNIGVLVIQNKPPTNWANFPSWRNTTTIPQKSRGVTSTTGIPTANMNPSNNRPNVRFEYALPATMIYSTTTVTQANVSNVGQGNTKQEVIGIQVVTTNTANPLTITKFDLTTTGTTSALTDISNARIWSTGTVNTFDTVTQFGIEPSPNGTFSINGNMTLNPGNNYFWLTYDIKATATIDNFIDATCTAVTVSASSKTVASSSPTGNRKIRAYQIVGSNLASSNTDPLHYYLYNNVWEGIYLKSELGAAKDFTRIGFYKNSGSNTVNNYLMVEIWMKATADSVLTSGPYTLPGDYVKVYDGAFPNNIPKGWIDVALLNAFAYNGTSNVQVLVKQYAGSYFINMPAWANYPTAVARARTANSNVTMPTSLNMINRMPYVRFEYNPPSSMTYVSTTTIQPNLMNAFQGLADQEIIGVQIVTNNSANPLNVSSLSFNTTGCSNASTDILNAKVFYTGSNNTFSNTAPQFGSTLPSPNGAFSITGTQNLTSGSNYFWLAYSLKPTATVGNYVDGQCVSATVSSSVKTPTVTNPGGNRQIVGALSGVYYIGVGGDYANFTTAINALNTFGISGPVTFKVFSGTYNEQITLGPVTNASASNPIVFESDANDSTLVILTYASSNNTTYTLTLNGAQFITFRSMTIRNTGSNFSNVISLTGTANNNTFSNNIISGTGTSNSSSILVNGLPLTSLKILYNYISQTNGYGLNIRGSNTTSLLSGLEIDNNIIQSNYYTVYLYYVSATKIRSNTIINNGTNQGYGANIMYAMNGSIITSNKITFSGSSFTYGLYFRLSDGTALNRNLIANNFVMHSGSTTNQGYGIYAYDNDYTDIYHNNVNMNLNTTNNAGIYVYSMVSNNIKNNIVRTIGNGLQYASTTGLVSDYNNISSNGGNYGMWLTSAGANLAGWKSLSGQDAHSISVNPNYTSATNLHVTNFAIKGLGTPIANVTTDIDGDSRNPITPDMGADELSVNYDADITKIVAPISPLCPGSQTVKVTLKNHAMLTLATVNINWSINGTLQPLFAWSGNLIKNDSIDVTIGTFNFTSGTALIKAWTSLPNGQVDQLSVNDSASSTVTVNSLATIEAGTNSTVCAGYTYSTSATGSGYSTLTWSTSGTGTFVNGTALIATYTPSVADIASGSVYLRLTAVSTNGCGSVKDSLLLTISPKPIVNFTGLPATACPNTTPITLTGSPVGGVFSGPGISGLVFNPKTAGSGNHSIKYVFTSVAGCKDSISKSVLVQPSVFPTISGLQTTYCVSESADILVGTPAGGTFSGSITTSTFDPAVVGIGTKSVKYTYVSPTTSCSFDTTYTTQVIGSPVISILGLASAYCANDSSVLVSATPTGGTFTGPGIVGNKFYPTIAGVGTHNIIYNVTSAGCVGSASKSVTVNALPVVSFSGYSALGICANALNPDVLTGSPLGGSFTGTGIVGNTFDAAIAGVGTHPITYTYTDLNGCTNFKINNIQVLSFPIANAGNDTIVNYNTIATPHGSYTSGTGTMNYSWAPASSLVNALIQNPTTLPLTSSKTFTLTVSSTNSCSSTDDVQVTVTGGALSATSSATPSTICSGDTAQLTVLPSGGNGTYTYAWTSIPAGFTSNSASPKVWPAATTQYNVAVTSGAQTVNTSVTVTVNLSPTVDFTGLNSSYCSNAAAANLVGSPIGGTFSGNGIIGSQFNPTTAGPGTYQITYSYTNLSGCSNTKVKSVQVIDAPIANAGSDITINSGLTTTLSGSFTGGTGTTSYSWTPAAKLVNATIQNPTTTVLTASTVYTLTVTSSPSTCASTDDVTVFVNVGTLTVNASATPSTICEGDSSQLLALPSGGSGTYTYAWSSNPVGFTSTLANPYVLPTVNTTYTVLVNDGSANANSSTSVTVKAKPIVSFSGLASSYCSNVAPVTLAGLPNGGTFSGAGISGSQFTPSVAGVGSHSVSYSFTNVAGCTSIANQTTTVKSTPIANAGTDLTITQGNDTILYGSAAGDNLKYSWSPAAQLISSTIAMPSTDILFASQSFTLTVTDSISGCFTSDVMNVNVTGGVLSGSASATPSAICAGDSALLAVLVSGGNGIYTYAWSSNPVGFSSTQASIKVSPTVTTTYTVNVTSGAANISSSATVTVSTKPTVDFNGLAASYCLNEPAVNLNGSPIGGVFTGNGVSGNSFNPSTAGVGVHDVTYTYTNLSGCSNFITKSVTVKSAPIADAGLALTIAQGNDTILYGSATGSNLKYAWTPAAMLINSTIAVPSTVILNATQIFTLTVTDSITGCSSTDDVMVKVIGGPLTLVATATPSTICFGDSTVLDAIVSGGTGNYTYLWTSNPTGLNSTSKSIAVTPNLTTVYTLVVYDGQNTNSSTVTVVVHSKPVVALGGLDTVYCKNGLPAMLTGVPTGGVYSGNGMLANIFTPSLAGVGAHTISYTYTDGNGCSDIASKITNVYNNPIASAGVDMDINIFNDTILYGSASSGTGSYSYMWAPSVFVVDPTLAQASTTILNVTTQFTLTATDLYSGCKATDEVIVVVHGGALSVNPTANPSTICQGSSTQLQALGSGGTGIYNYYWASTPSGFNSTIANPIVSPTVTTTYTVIMSDGSFPTNGSVVVVVNPLPVVSITGENASYCANNVTDTLIGLPLGGIFIGAGMSGNIFNPGVAGAGNYDVIYVYSTLNGCINSDTVQMNVKALPVSNAGSDISIACGGNGIIGSAPVSGMTYSWSPVTALSNSFISNPTASPNLSVNYILTTTSNTTGCSNTDDVLVTISNGPTALVSNDTIICVGASVNVYATGGLSYVWSNGVTSGAFTASPIITTTYTVTVTDGNCFDVDSVLVTVNDPTVYLGPDITVIDTQSIVLNAGFGYAQYLWSNGATTQSILIKPYINANLGLNTYKVVVIDAYGCQSEDSITINFVTTIGDLNRDLNFSIYPNPSKGLFNLELSGVVNQYYQVEILSLQGQLISQENIYVDNATYSKQFDLSSFPKGVYIIRVMNDGVIKTRKLIIQ